jgi:hypothetical protein
VIVAECNIPFCNSHGETEKLRELTIRVVGWDSNRINPEANQNNCHLDKISRLLTLRTSRLARIPVMKNKQWSIIQIPTIEYRVSRLYNENFNLNFNI